MAEIQDNYLTGKLLIAMPSLGDPRFHRAVIFVCAHDENGAMGLVINHTMPDLRFTDLVGQLKIESDIMINFQKLNMPVMYGGPVESARGFLLHSGDFTKAETMKVNKSYGITGTVDALKDVALGKGPENLMFILGYAGWEARQLDDELLQNAWLVTEPDENLVFGKDPNVKWENAVKTIGIDPWMLSGTAGSA